MRTAKLILVVVAGLVLTSLLIPTGAQAQDQPKKDPKQNPAQKKNVDNPLGVTAERLAEMMKKAERYTKPGEHHKLLERFLGKWNTETRIFLAGKATPPEKGTVVNSWLMEGRWLKSESKGKMLGRPFHTFMILGYDNFKMSYVNTVVNSVDTAMLRSEGDAIPGGKALIMYGTLDEYTTGEHDKMVKTVIRFPSDDKIIMEVHDLPIGEKNTKVIEIVYIRES